MDKDFNPANYTFYNSFVSIGDIVKCNIILAYNEIQHIINVLHFIGESKYNNKDYYCFTLKQLAIISDAIMVRNTLIAEGVNKKLREIGNTTGFLLAQVIITDEMREMVSNVSHIRDRAMTMNMNVSSYLDYDMTLDIEYYSSGIEPSTQLPYMKHNQTCIIFIDDQNITRFNEGKLV